MQTLSALRRSALDPPNPLEPALAGRVQCYEPNEAKKTCRALASYLRTGGPRYPNTALVLIAATVTLETTTPVEVKAGAVCPR
jgi:hypothetical protein